MPIFEYGDNEISYLKCRDKKLSAAIDAVGQIERAVMPDPFMALVMSVVSQQISSKAADTVWSRLVERMGAITPAALSECAVEAIQGCGLSMRKAGYIQGIAQAAHSGQVDFAALPALSDQAVIRQLSALRGVGVWTAEMLLIFSLCRPDVVSFGDLAIRRGMMRLYGLETLPREQFERYCRRYSPYGSVASLYLWEWSQRE